MSNARWLVGSVLAGALALTSTKEAHAQVPWSTFQGNPSNTGFLWVNTKPATSVKFTVNVGSVEDSSPVVAPDGTIYVGNLGGELVAINPSGTVRFRRNYFGADSMINSTPTVAPDGTVYVMINRRVCAGTSSSCFESVLTRVNGITGNFVTFLPLGAGTMTQSSVKVWPVTGGFRVFVTIPPSSVISAWNPTAQSHPVLVAFNEGLQVQKTTPVGTCHTINGSTGGFFSDLWTTFQQIFTGGVTFDTSGVDLYNEKDWPRQTVALAESSISGPDNPTIVAGDTCGISINRFFTAAKLFGSIKSIDFSQQNDLTGSPSIINGMVLVGGSDHKLRAFDMENGDLWWTTDLGQKIWSAPASFGRQIFVPSETQLNVVDYNGVILGHFTYGNSKKTRASALLTGSAAYVPSENGFHTVAFDLSTSNTISSIKGGRSSAALGADGTVFVVSYDGKLRALNTTP